MKKFFGSLLALLCIKMSLFGQAKDEVQNPTLGIQFFFNDFTTARNIRNTSLNSTLNAGNFGKIKEMSPGLAINYIQGLSPKVDFTSTLAASYLEYPFRDEESNPNNDAFLLEADASVRAKMFTNRYWFVPYVQLGVGVSKFRGYYGAFIPAGVGIQISFFEEAYLLINSQYRIPVTQTSNYHFFHSVGISGNLGRKNK